MPVVSAPALLVGGRLTGPGAVEVQDGRVVRVVDEVPPPGPDHTRLEHGLLTAGLVDLQVNGFAGQDLAAADAAGWAAVRAALAGTGVTAFAGTYVTAPVPAQAAGLQRAAEVVAQGAAGGARLLGVHLEGPFISPVRAGAHDAALMCDPTDESLDPLLAGPVPLVVTLAPERAHGLAAVRRLADAGVVVSLGHSDADASVASAAVDAGARMVTHLFNAMRPLGHRDPALVGVALDDARLRLGLICDLVHVDPLLCRVLFRAAAGRVVLVTDAVAAAGMPPGRYELGGQAVEVGEPGAAPRRPDGTLAGSALTLDLAVRNAVRCGAGADEALAAASLVPARLLGRSDVGDLAPGTYADLVHWSDDLHVAQVWLDGRPWPT